MPIPDSEAEHIMAQVQEAWSGQKPVDQLRDRRAHQVADGPFASFEGNVEEVDEERRGSRWRCRSLHGRRPSTRNSQVEKV